MPIPNFVQVAGTRSPGEIIQSQHVNILNTQDQINWDNWYSYLTNTGLENAYINDGAVTSRKISANFMQVSPANKEVQSPNGLSVSISPFTSEYFGNFTTIMEKPNQLIHISDIRSLFSMSFYIVQTFFTVVVKKPIASIELWDLTNNIRVAVFEFHPGGEYYSSVSSHQVYRSTTPQDISLIVNDFINKEASWSTNYRPSSLTQTSVSFSFKAIIWNMGNSPSSNINGTGYSAGTFGAMRVESLKYSLSN